MSDTDKPRVVTTVVDGVADVRMNRPEKRNAFDVAMCEALVATGEQLAADRSVRAVVLSGEGASFCAGIDLGLFAGMMPAEGGERPARKPTDLYTSGLTHMAQQAAWAWQEVPVPVIAAVHGHAFGAGIQIALGADIRIAHPGTSFSVREVYWGLVPDMTGTLTLLSLLALDKAKELVFTARIFDASEAESLGVVTRLADDPHAEALELARTIAALNPDSVRGAKRLLNAAATERAGTQFAAERDVIGSLIGSSNQRESVMSHMEKRPPKYADPA